MAQIDSPLLNELADALKKGEAEAAALLAKQAIEEGVDPLHIVQGVLVPTLTEVGERFQCFEIFLPELMMAGAAAEQVTEVVESALAAAGKAQSSLGTVVLGTVSGDMHDIGRDIVSTLLSSHGFKVINLGRDVGASTFLEQAQARNAQIVGLSSLMTTTLPAQKRTIQLFEEVGARDAYRIIIGGGAASPEWADEISADGYAEDAAAAVELCKRLLGV